jgi:hypothetical protein
MNFIGELSRLKPMHTWDDYKYDSNHEQDNGRPNWLQADSVSVLSVLDQDKISFDAYPVFSRSLVVNV